MAIGSFADLRPYQLAAAQPVQNPLNALIQGFQQGQAIQQLPEQMANNQLAQQLALEIQRQKLEELRNPNLAIARQVQRELALRSIDPLTGVVATPEGITETVATPGAITPAQQTILESGGSISPVSPGPQITPITVGGISTGFSQDLGRQMEAQKRQQDAQIALAKARAEASGVGVRYETDINGNLVALPTRLTLGQAPSATSVKTETGENLKPLPKPGKSTNLTANQRAALLERYGKVKDIVGPLEGSKLLNEQGQLDFDKLSTEVGNASRIQDLEDIRRKQEAIPTGLRDEAAGWIAAQRDLANLKSKLVDIKDEEPGTFQNALAVVAGIPSTGFFSSLVRQTANSQLEENTKDKETLRAGLKTAVQTALSGKAVTKNEESSLTALLPLADDTIKDLVRKSGQLDTFINNKLQGLAQSGQPIQIQSPTSSAPTIQIRSIKKVQ